jgi:hypothetical protein
VAADGDGGVHVHSQVSLPQVGPATQRECMYVRVSDWCHPGRKCE